MTYLKDITKVELSEKEVDDTYYPSIRVVGYRTESDKKIIMQFIKKNGEWQRHSGYHLTFTRSLAELNDSTFEHEWDKIAEEILDHPKVRLYTLF